VDYSVYLIDSHLAEIVFLAVEEGKKDNLLKARLDEIEKYANVAIKNLKKYVGVFALGGPALDRYKGQWEWYKDRPERAYQLWRSAAEKAHVFPSTYEEGRAELLLGENLPSNDPERAIHLHKAHETFTASGYDTWALRAQQGL
jgi:hypothetical protein